VIKVLRLIEYEFEDYETAEKHLAQCSVPANGAHDFGLGMIRSTIIIRPFDDNDPPSTSRFNSESAK